MHITVAGKQVDTGEALQTHVRDGLAAIAKKYFDHALEANVTFHRDNRAQFACDINLKAGRNLFMRAEGGAPDFSTAVLFFASGVDREDVQVGEPDPPAAPTMNPASSTTRAARASAVATCRT